MVISDDDETFSRDSLQTSATTSRAVFPKRNSPPGMMSLASRSKGGRFAGK